MIVADLDAGTALVASTAITAVASVVAAIIAISANRNARGARKNTEPNGGTSSHDQLMGRIDGRAAELERQIANAATAALAADRSARDAAGLAAQATNLLPVIARDLSATRAALDTHLVSSAEFGGAIVEEGNRVLERLAALEAAATEPKERTED